MREQESTWTLEMLGDAYAAAGRDKDAAATYARVLARANERAWLYEDPAFYRVAALHYRAGVAYQKAGDAAKAREQLQAFVDLAPNGDPGLPTYADARKRLQDAGK